MRAEEPTLQSVFRGHKAGITAVAFTSDRKLVTASLDRSIMVWHPLPHTRPFRFSGHKGPVHGVDVDHAGGMIVSASQDRTIRVWKNSVAAESTTLKGHFGAVRCVHLAREGELMVSASDDKSVRVWALQKLRPLQTLVGHSKWVRACALNVDGSAAASGGDDGTVRVWDPKTRRCCTHLFEDGPSGPPVHCLAFQPLVPCVATGNDEGAINTWDLRTRRLVQRYAAHGGAVTGLSWHPTGAFMLSTGADALIRAWDVRAGQLFYTIRSHKSGSVAGVAFSPCGSYFATGGMDGQAMLWKADFQAGLLGSINDPVRGPTYWDTLLTQRRVWPGPLGLASRPASPSQVPPSPSQDHAPLQSVGPCSTNLVDPSSCERQRPITAGRLSGVLPRSAVGESASAPNTRRHASVLMDGRPASALPLERRGSTGPCKPTQSLHYVADWSRTPEYARPTHNLLAKNSQSYLYCNGMQEGQVSSTCPGEIVPASPFGPIEPNPVQVLQKLFGKLTGAVSALEARLSSGEHDMHQMSSVLADISQRLGIASPKFDSSGISMSAPLPILGPPAENFARKATTAGAKMTDHASAASNAAQPAST